MLVLTFPADGFAAPTVGSKPVPPVATVVIPNGLPYKSPPPELTLTVLVVLPEYL